MATLKIEIVYWKYFYLICFISAIRLEHFREFVLPDVSQGDLLPHSHPARQELPSQDRRHPGLAVLPGQLVLQPFRPSR